MKTYSVIRTDLSPYHAPDFESRERQALSEISGVYFEDLNQLIHSRPYILITNTHTQLQNLPAKVLEQTKLIIHSNSGYDHFNSQRSYWENIPTIIGHEIRAQAVAEYSLTCVLTSLVELPQHLIWNKSRNWQRPLVRDEEIWIFGNGHIGKIVISTLKSLGAKVKVIDPFVPGSMSTWEQGDLRQARVVIACCGLNSSSYHLFNTHFFSHAHPELVFINGARGKLVDETALRNFLLAHPKAQAFLDVFNQEPFDQSWQHFPQVWKTSHIAGVYSQLDQRIIDFEKNVLSDFIKLDENHFKLKYHSQLLQNKWIQGELI